jgi:hypothetical protein
MLMWSFFRERKMQQQVWEEQGNVSFELLSAHLYSYCGLRSGCASVLLHRG